MQELIAQGESTVILSGDVNKLLQVDAKFEALDPLTNELGFGVAVKKGQMFVVSAKRKHDVKMGEMTQFYNKNTDCLTIEYKVLFLAENGMLCKAETNFAKNLKSFSEGGKQYNLNLKKNELFFVYFFNGESYGIANDGPYFFNLKIVK